MLQEHAKTVVDHVTTNASIIADLSAAVASFFALSTIWMEWIDHATKAGIGLLTLILLVLRIRAHLRK